MNNLSARNIVDLSDAKTYLKLFFLIEYEPSPKQTKIINFITKVIKFKSLLYCTEANTFNYHECAGLCRLHYLIDVKQDINYHDCIHTGSYFYKCIQKRFYPLLELLEAQVV